MPSRLGHASILLCCLAAASCKSAEEECEEARVLAERAWQSQIDAHEKMLAASIAAQAESKTRLVREVEPRLSDAAMAAATQRYDRSTDAWQRAFQASMNSMCSASPECAQLKRESAAAEDQQADMMEKLATERVALAAIRKAPADMKRAASGVVPDVANVALGEAKKASEAAAEACMDVKSAPSGPASPQ